MQEMKHILLKSTVVIMEKESTKRAFEIVLGCLLLISVYLLSWEGARLVAVEMEGRKTVVIDSGHGGDDPGKIGVGNVLEKDINLEIAELLETRLKKEDVNVIMTRTEDVMLADDGSSSKTAEDLKKRCAMINESGADCAVSIHQNSYSDEAIKGAQVFYFEHSEEGKLLAETLQSSLIAGLDPTNHRQAKGNVTYYLLKKTEIPIVIVECGFLSNPEEAKLLGEEKYQEKVADAVCAGIMEYLNGKEAL